MAKGNLSLIKVLFGILAVLFLNACNEQKQQAEQPLRPVRTITVSTPDLNRSHEFTAVVDASRKADLSFKISGKLTEFLVNQGDEVVKGQVIARLDDSDIKIQLKEVESLFDKAEADYDRGKNLIKSNTISQANFDQLRAQYNSAKARLDTAQNNLDYTELKASFSGIVAKKYTENYQEINARVPIIALHDLTNINLKIDIPESIMIHLKKTTRPTNVTARFDAIKDIEFPLTFKEIATQPDEVTRTYEVTLTMVASKEHTILPGMTAIVTSNRNHLDNGAEPHFLLPVKTVLKDSGGNYVFTVEDKGDGTGEIKKQSVTIGEITPLGIEIFTGVSQGDKVINAGMSKVSTGMKVKYKGD